MSCPWNNAIDEVHFNTTIPYFPSSTLPDGPPLSEKPTGSTCSLRTLDAGVDSSDLPFMGGDNGHTCFKMACHITARRYDLISTDCNCSQCMQAKQRHLYTLSSNDHIIAKKYRDEERHIKRSRLYPRIVSIRPVYMSNPAGHRYPAVPTCAYCGEAIERGGLLEGVCNETCGHEHLESVNEGREMVDALKVQRMLEREARRNCANAQYALFNQVRKDFKEREKKSEKPGAEYLGSRRSSIVDH